MSDAPHSLERGAALPFDAPDQWWATDEKEAPPPALDWAHAAARGILYDFLDRRGIKHGFSGIDEDVRTEIVQSMAAIIRAAAPPTCDEGRAIEARGSK